MKHTLFQARIRGIPVLRVIHSSINSSLVHSLIGKIEPVEKSLFLIIVSRMEEIGWFVDFNVDKSIAFGVR